MREAEAHYLEGAIGLARENRHASLAAHCHLGLGRLYGRTGQRRDSTQEHLAVAATMCREDGHAVLAGTIRVVESGSDDQGNHAREVTQ